MKKDKILMLLRVKKELKKQKNNINNAIKMIDDDIKEIRKEGKK